MRQHLWLGPTIVFAIALAVYVGTAPHGLTWAHHSADGGDLVTAALVGGVPHPSGYPTYVLLARLFAQLPWQTPAWRVTFLSMISGAAAAAFVAASVQRLIVRDTGASGSLLVSGSGHDDMDVTGWAHARQSLALSSVSWAVPGVIAGLSVAFAPLLWGQSTVAEVYALQACLAALLVWSMICWRTSGRILWSVVAGLVLGLSLGNHLTSIWLVPLVTTCLIASAPQPFARQRAVIALLLAVALGLLVYAYLPVAAAANPPVNWGNPRSLAGFLWVVSGQIYHQVVFAVSGTEALGRLSAWSNMLWGNFLPWGICLALAGLAWLFRSDRAIAWGMVASLALGLIWAIGYDTTDSVYTLLPGWVMIGLWIGLGAAWLMHWLRRIDIRAGVAVAFVGLALLAVPLLTNWTRQDLRRDYAAEDYLVELLQIAEPGAVILTVGDKATFALWYARYGLETRTDIIPVSRDLWPFDSYRRTLGLTHPSLGGQQPLNDLEELLDRAFEQRRPMYVSQVGTASAVRTAPKLPVSSHYSLRSVPLPPTATERVWSVWRVERAPGL